MVILWSLDLSLGWTVALRTAPATAQAPPPVSAAAPTSGAEGPSSGRRQAVVPPGQEAVLSDILGRGVEFPGKCRFAGASADRAVILSTYECPTGKVVFELGHPGRPPSGSINTAEFAMTLRSGAPPTGFTDALTAHIRARESAFKWLWVGATSAP